MSVAKSNDLHAWQWLGFSAIAFFVLMVYSPALMHVPRSDQVMYLAEIAHKKTLADLTIGSLDLNRHRQFAPGDELLFRPVDYVLLGAQKYFFGYNFLCWQALAIAMHLGVVWLLLRLLLTVHCGWPAVFCTAFFALLFVNMEMVVWHHISSYLVFVACILVVLRRSYLITSQKGSGPKDYAVMFAALSLAAFTHEMANVIALGMALLLWCSRPAERRWAVWLAVVPVIYTAASLFNAWAHPFTFTQALPPAFPTGPGYTFLDWLYAVGTWLYVGIFPLEFKWVLAGRNMISPDEVQLIKPVSLFHWPTVLAISAAAIYASCRFKRSMLGLTAFGFALVFAAIIAVGRGGQIMMWYVLRVNTYYMYIFWIFMAIALFAFVDWSLTRLWTRRLLGAVLAGLIGFNAYALYVSNAEQARANNQILVLARSMDMLIEEKGKEPGFSFYVDAGYPGNYMYRELRRPDDPPQRVRSFIEALYPQYFTSENPKYKFLVK